MVSNKNSKKARKPIETTLGKAPVKPKDKETDISHLRKPIETSVSGIKQVLSIWETATNEVKNFLMYECDIMYECRTCRTIFRSLANFILHKRNYCKDKFTPLGCIKDNDTVKLNKDPPKEPNIENSSLGKVIQKLHEIDRVRESAKQFLTADLSSGPDNEPVKNMDDREEKASNFNKMILEKIDSNGSGIFQTLVGDSSNTLMPNNTKRTEFMKTEVMELHKKLENDVPVLDTEGKICGFASNKLHQTSLFPKSEFKCTECNNRFATQKSLTNHIKYVHNPSRIIYICPTCKDTFANPWCVYRHLLKVHRMTNKQVRRMREQVHNNWIRRGEESSILKKASLGVNQSAGDNENQWINDIEGDKDFQMCAGCGKHFERKAALHSHSQLCAKRLEVCNNIKENARKKGEEEAVEKSKLVKVTSDKSILKGASKRKGRNICTYRRKEEAPSEINEFVSKSILDKANTSDNTSNVIPDSNSNILGLSPVANDDDDDDGNSFITKTIDDCNQTTKMPDDNTLTEAQSSENTTLSLINAKSDKTALECCNSDPPITRLKQINMRDVNYISQVTHGNDIKKTLSAKLSEDLSPEETSIKESDILAKDNVKTKVHCFPTEESRTRRSKSVGISEKPFQTKLEDFVADKNDTNELDVEKQTGSYIPSVKSHECSSSSKIPSTVISSTKDSHTEGEPENKSYSQKSSGEQITRPNECVDSTERLFSPSSSWEIISRSNSTEEPIYLSCSEDSLQESMQIPSSSNRDSLPIKREKLDEEEVCPLSLDSVNSSRSVCVISDSNEDSSSDLFSNEVSFEMFCEKVASVGHLNKNENNIPNSKVTASVKRKRKLNADIESTENDVNILGCSENEDDVIFVGEGKKKARCNFDVVENGFPGFSNDETSQTPFAIDFSNLSYNNPLKSKTKDTLVAPQVRSDNASCKTKESYIKNEKVPNDVKNEFNFIPRAAPFMDGDKLLCIPCDLTFESFSLLLWHMSAHFSWFRFQCSKCSFITFNESDCMSHVRKDHNLTENTALSCILPLPNWKTVLMSHEFRLLKDCNDLRGKHTDEKIGFDENHDQSTESPREILETDAILFGEYSSSEELSHAVIEKSNIKKRNKFGKVIIDIQEAIQDLQKLPAPVELAMPADVSEVFRSFIYDEDTLSPDEPVESLDHYADESNDDWGLSKVCEFEEPIKPKVIAKDYDEDTTKGDIVSLNIRPSRIRTKVKQNDDFLYYDNDINNALKVSELFKCNSKQVVPGKPKVSSKSVPTTQKKKC